MKKYLSDVIIAPIITEKSTQIGDEKYVFKVLRSCNKVVIRCAIERLFNIKVAHVRTMNYSGRFVSFKGVNGRTCSFKKAVVTLVPGSKRIELGV